MLASRRILLGLAASALAVLATVAYHQHYLASAAAAAAALPPRPAAAPPAASAAATPAAPERLAFATFLSTRAADDGDDGDDAYFTAARVLAYQLLHAAGTRTRRGIPLLVLVTPAVSARKRARLAADGAVVVPVALVASASHWETPGRASWVDQFAKLRLWTLADYDRILYLDGDMLLAAPLDGVFDDAAAAAPALTRNESLLLRADEAPLPARYLLAGVSDTGGAAHASPPEPGAMLNGGFFVLRPDAALFAYYESVLAVPHRFDAAMMEQSLLNYAHRREGNMPWVALAPGRWNVNWPRLRDLRAGAASLHDKFWDKANEAWIDRELVEMWWRVRGEMEGYWRRAEEDEAEQAGAPAA